MLDDDDNGLTTRKKVPDPEETALRFNDHCTHYNELKVPLQKIAIDKTLPFVANKKN